MQLRLVKLRRCWYCFLSIGTGQCTTALAFSRCSLSCLGKKTNPRNDTVVRWNLHDSAITNNWCCDGLGDYAALRC